MQFAILAALLFMCGVFDSYLTVRRIKDWGPNVELNRLIRFTSTRLGPELAVLLFVLGPLVGWAYIFKLFDFPIGLGLMVGWKLKMSYVQILSLHVEKDAKLLRSMIDKKFGSGDATLPSSDATDRLGPKSPEDDHAG